MNKGNYFIIILLIASIAIGVVGRTDQMKERILSPDYDVAKKALEENIEKKDITAICLSLKHRAMSLRRKAADALGSIQSKEAVECLTEALKVNRNFMPFDTESTYIRDELNRSLIKALRAITGLNLPLKDKYSYVEDPEVEKIIAQIKEWQKANQNR